MDCDNADCPVGCPPDHAMPNGEEPPIVCGTFGPDDPPLTVERIRVAVADLKTRLAPDDGYYRIPRAFGPHLALAALGSSPMPMVVYLDEICGRAQVADPYLAADHNLITDLRSEQVTKRWWSDARKRWGKLQQVRKGTWVRCHYCEGMRGGCPMCCHHRGLMERDFALRDLESHMEVLCK